ncbi:MAG TPA: NAD(P)H-hydrate dehydratase [Candidatus Saccharimonadales bacterium]|nr:NAD(P)H-hydrate dehydratase [Candidatus Saccharimonadales bacterium]
MPLPVITVSQMREWERVTWASGQSEEAVIGLAGKAVARRAEELTKAGEFILVFAGKGHNGDDAIKAGEALSNREVQIINVVDPDPITNQLPSLMAKKPSLIIDGLFGIGLNRPLGYNWVKLLQAINRSGRPILSIDIPSGLNADTGEALDDAVRANITLTLGAAKRGMLRPAAWPFVGRIEAAGEIGLLPYPFSTEISMILPSDFGDFPPPRPLSGHKGTFGHLAIIAGSFGYHGASVLAAKGAQRAQPGLITLFTDEQVYNPVAEQLQSVMVKTWQSDFKLPQNCTGLVMGPGLANEKISPSTKEVCRTLWKEARFPVLADASALHWLPEGPCPEKALRVMTPHPGEASHLLNMSTAEVQEDRLKALRELSRRFGDCHVVLKGHQTMVGQGKEEVLVNCSGNPHLAQGGSGDLLAGYIGGWLAQPALQKDPLRTITYAVWQHGAAADRLQSTRANWTVEDLGAELGNVAVTPS